MKKLLILLVLVGVHGSARAETIGIGLFLGQPTGLDLKIPLQRRSALDIVLGVNQFDDPHLSYGHVQYLATLGVARGRSVNVPFRIGVGVALIGVTDDNTVVAARVPLQLGLRFRRSPIEIYGEIAFVVLFDDGTDTDVDGGAGIRVYF